MYCDPVITNKQMGKNMSYGGFPLNENDTASPCGLIALTFFNGN